MTRMSLEISREQYLHIRAHRRSDRVLTLAHEPRRWRGVSRRLVLVRTGIGQWAQELL
jgi:hypothetical protein